MRSKCECDRDQYCHRFQREMSGRFREICAGVNIDLGTAAAFRAQWAREADAVARRGATAASGAPVQLVLKTDQMPGDAVVMTAAIYSLHRAHPNRYLTAVDSEHREVFDHNPDVVPVATLRDPQPLHMHYPAIHQCNERGIHFMQAWCEHLSAALGVHVPLLTDRPRLYFPEGEQTPPVEDYWLVCSGGKRDLTAKLWGCNRYQRVVHSLRGAVPFVQVGSGADDHPRLDGVYDAVGTTTLRQLFDLVRRARGVLCGVSLLMHVAAALDKPAIVVAGGREPVPWNAYPKQHYLHTVGALPCTSSQGHVGRACWRSRTVPVGDGLHYDQHPCELPVGDTPRCMTLITPEEVAALVLRYNSYQHESTTHG